MSLVEAQPAGARRTTATASNTLAWLLASALIAGLVWAGGLWNQLANSRVLDLLMRSGIVAFTDADQGFYRGVPDTQYYVASQDPIDWGMLLLTFGLLLTVFAIRSARFASVARLLGSPVAHSRAMGAHLRGLSVGAFRPYGLGRTVMADALELEGSSRRSANQVLLLVRFLHVVELIGFTALGLVALSWSTALGQLVWPVGIAAVAYFLVRPTRERRDMERGPFHGLSDAASALSQEPASFARLVAFSLFAFFLEVAAVYALSQAFSSTNVILNIDFPVVLMAVVAGYVASFIEITPGGLGQFEWGMAMALYIGGLGMPEAVTIPLLYAVLRYSVMTVVYFATRVRRPAPPTSYDLMDELERG